MEALQIHISLAPIAGFLRGLKPDPLLTVSEWADNFRFLPQESAEPNKFRTSRTPYMREIVDHLSIFDPAQEIIFKKGSQIGATESGNNWLGYTIGVAPIPFLYVMPTDTMMQDTSKNRIQKMIDTTPVLRAKIKPPKAKNSNNTILFKEFEGGFFKGVGANSPVGLASTAVRGVYLDEIDRYPMDVAGEGSAIDLAKTRTSTYGARRKMFLTSTPTRKDTSAIDNAFQKTGQRYYHVPCPHCGALQSLKFTQLRYDVTQLHFLNFKVEYECEHCGQMIQEHNKTKMFADGQWIPLYPEKENGLTYGYHLSAMYAPYGWYSWVDMVKDYEAAANDIPKMITFTNTKLGEVYEDIGEKPNWESLYDRSEDFEINRPFKNVSLLTAGVDVQADRIEIEIVGWIKGKRSQSIDYRVLVGDTDKQAVWDELGKIVNETWKREDGSMLQLRLMAVDSGYNTNKVYSFTKKYSTARVVPIKGREKLDTFYSAPKAVNVTKAGKKINSVKVWGVGSSYIKSELYGMLKQVKDPELHIIPDGYCHFPKREPSYFRGITAEELKMITNRKGYREYVWIKKYERNEPLDCRVYARAAAAIVGVDRWNDERWQRELYNAVPVVQQNEIEFNNKLKPVKKRDSNFW